jgi:hypothetical protein
LSTAAPFRWRFGNEPVNVGLFDAKSLCPLGAQLAYPPSGSNTVRSCLTVTIFVVLYGLLKCLALPVTM